MSKDTEVVGPRALSQEINPVEGPEGDDASTIAAVVIQEKVKRKWTSYLWDTLDKSPEERKFLFKLDSAILTFGTFGFFMKYLDQSNINNSFVSGMKEDLNLYGNQLNYMGTCYVVGYAFGMIPFSILMTRYRPSLVIPTLEVIWTILTFCQSKCTNESQMYAMRLLIGLAESGFYPGMTFVIGSWYRSDELGRRACIFQAAAGVGPLISSYLMAGVYSLGGKGGLKGWQWLFVMCGIISLPVALSGYLLIPDLPENSRALYLSKEEIAYGKRRMQFEGRKTREPYTKEKIQTILTTWHVYGLTFLYIFFDVGSVSGTPVFAQFLKDSTNPKYTVSQINVYPSTTYAVQIFSTLLYGWVSDTFCRGRRWPPIAVGGVLNIIYFVSLAVWDIPEGWRWFCYIGAGTFPGLAGVIMSWAQEICTDSEERAIVIGSMNEFGNAMQAWLPLVVWQQVDAPRYRKGFITATCISTAYLLNTFVVWYLHKTELLLKSPQIADGQEVLEASLEDNPPQIKVTN